MAFEQLMLLLQFSSANNDDIKTKKETGSEPIANLMDFTAELTFLNYITAVLCLCKLNVFSENRLSSVNFLNEFSLLIINDIINKLSTFIGALFEEKVQLSVQIEQYKNLKY